jgi:hypothetical protein
VTKHRFNYMNKFDLQLKSYFRKEDDKESWVSDGIEGLLTPRMSERWRRESHGGAD